MADAELFSIKLFDTFPEPVLLVEGGVLRYCNPAARRQFPDLQLGGALPAVLDGLGAGLQETAMVMGRAAGGEWRISVQETPLGQLVLFRPVWRHTPVGSPGRVTLQLRQQTAGLSAVIQRLFPNGELTEEKYRQYLALANQGIYRLMRLVDHIDLLDRDEAEVYRPGPVDLAGLCRAVANELEDVSRMAGWRFAYESELKSLIMVGDEALLRRMLIALLSNAAKAAAGGRFGLRLRKRGDRAVLLVWDEGLGLPTEEMAALFGEWEERQPGLDPAEGAGLGLLLVRRVTNCHGGTLVMESPSTGGFQAVISLPIQCPESGMPLRSDRLVYGAERHSSILMEMADVLPPALYIPEYE